MVDLTVFCRVVKVKFQEMLFPEGFNYSIKNRDYRTSKVNSLFVLTSSFKESYNSKKQKTHCLKSSESSIVHESVKISNQLLIDFETFAVFVTCIYSSK